MPASPSVRIGSPIGDVSVSLSPVVGLHPSNPFVGPRRRASIGVMSMHEMEGVEQSGLLNRLDDIVGNDSNHMHSPAAQSASIDDVSFDEIDAPTETGRPRILRSRLPTSFFFDPTEGKQDQTPPSKSLPGKPLPTPPPPKKSPPSKKTQSLDQHSVPKVFKSPVVVQPTGNPSPVFTSSSGSGGGEVQQPNVTAPPVPPMRQAQQSKPEMQQVSRPEMQQVSRPEMQQRPQEPARQPLVGHSPVVQEPVSRETADADSYGAVDPSQPGAD
ncbi:hypothetical protein DL89DRAFT_58422 [Linderina pennispora]|uniref:Uncharacterized protein n=1 Tax=Linderina pennispora TaxID=61395 RepID=A0A1Y1VZL7_9FUNG|nr:uncharacterized protein DL89DRAFT_58422 [Linderina pennispora]ORX66699.1 hypothetical protein DL89DRAFT_58422 [Linderina pennispora]